MKKWLFVLLALASLSATAAEKFLTLEDAALAQAKKWQESGVAKPLISEDGTVLFPFGQSIPTLVCAPLQVCKIFLEPGETLNNNPWAGDQVRFLLSRAVVGSGAKETVVIGVKPTDIDIKTTLSILTNRRAYTINLVSRNMVDFLPNMGFYYPENMLDQWEKDKAKKAAAVEKEEKLVNFELSAATVDQIDLDYTIEGDDYIKPTRVMNNGTKTYLMMPRSVTKMEMPILMLYDRQDNLKQVNYRTIPNKSDGSVIFEVDKIFDKAVLFLGEEGAEGKVVVTRKKGVQSGGPRWLRNLFGG